MSTPTHIWIHHDGQRYGPMTMAEAIASVQRERFLLVDLGWHEGMAEWKPLGEIPVVRDHMAMHMTMQRPLPKFEG